MNQVALLWRASPASTELELRVVDWVRQLLGLPDGWHGHIEDTASTSTLAALIAARHVTGRNVVVCSEHAHSSVEKGARMLGMELSSKVPRRAADARHAQRTARSTTLPCVVATVGTTSFASVDPVRELARARACGGRVAARRRRVRGLVVDLRGGAVVAGRRRARGLARHQSAQVARWCRWTARFSGRRVRTSSGTAFSLVPEYLRTPEDVYALSEYGPALGRRFRSLKLWAVLRCFGAEGLRAHAAGAHAAGGALRGAGSRPIPGWELVAPQRFSLVVLPAERKRRGERADPRARESER